MYGDRNGPAVDGHGGFTAIKLKFGFLDCRDFGNLAAAELPEKAATKPLDEAPPSTGG